MVEHGSEVRAAIERPEMSACLKPLRTLFRTGTCPAGDDAIRPLLDGLAHSSEDGRHWVLSRRLLRVRENLTNDDEAVAAILATDALLAEGWARILAARCREAGQLTQPDEPVSESLVQMVGRLGRAAGVVEAAMTSASLEPTAHQTLERALIGAGAEQAGSVPALVRVMAGAAELGNLRQNPSLGLASLDVSGEQVDDNWCRERLLALPGEDPVDARWILHGRRPDSPSGLDSGTVPVSVLEDWVLPNPWPLLLALIGYVQDSWSAEGIGGLLLEVSSGQNPQQPAEVEVLVSLDDGVEVLCGTLGGLVLGVLARLDMGLFPRTPTESELNLALAPLVGELLRRRVWAYQEGLSRDQGQYRLATGFSDACYRIAGARSLGRNAHRLRRAVREQAVQWWQDRRVAAPTEVGFTAQFREMSR